jgi:hypothetical protein
MTASAPSAACFTAPSLTFSRKPSSPSSWVTATSASSASFWRIWRVQTRPTSSSCPEFGLLPVSGPLVRSLHDADTSRSRDELCKGTERGGAEACRVDPAVTRGQECQAEPEVGGESVASGEVLCRSFRSSTDFLDTRRYICRVVQLLAGKSHWVHENSARLNHIDPKGCVRSSDCDAALTTHQVHISSRRYKRLGEIR